MGVTKEYLDRLFNARPMPKDAFSHGAALLYNDRINIDFETDNYSRLMDKDIYLGNIKDDKLIRIAQEGIMLFQHLYDMARREPGLRPVFNVLFYGWADSIGVTRMQGGLERRAQATVGRGMNSIDTQQGGLAPEIPQMEGEEINPTGFLGGIRRRMQQANVNRRQ